MNKRTISSEVTFITKFVFPTIWISWLGLVTLALFLGVFRGPDWMKWQGLFLWIAGSTFLYWACVRLKKVRADDSAIYVSNYLKEIRIPLDAIRNVTENCNINPRHVKIWFRMPTAFGTHIIFLPAMPPGRFFLFNWNPHPIVNELKEMAHLNGPPFLRNAGANKFSN